MKGTKKKKSLGEENALILIDFSPNFLNWKKLIKIKRKIKWKSNAWLGVS